MMQRNASPMVHRARLFLALGLLTFLSVAAPAAAPAQFGNVNDDPAAPQPPPVEDADARIERVPVERPIPEQFPVVTKPPRLSAESFGVGWPAAAAVGIALVAVLGMALMWRREPA